MKILKKQMGYTIIELLAVMFILVTVGGVVASIMITSLRGSNRSTTVNEIRQTGDGIIGQMSKMITYARGFEGVSLDGVTYSTNCVVPIPTPPDPSPTPVPYPYIKITNFDNAETVFSCPDASTIASSSAGAPVNLVDPNNIIVNSCSFYCSQNDVASPPIINIQFSLSKKTAGLFSENNVTIPFETSVSMRNL